MGVLDALLPLSLPALVLLHLAAAPYTKVEESFNLQATHDVLVYGTPTADAARKLAARYDHFAFPGAVPRTFAGPVLLAGLAQPVLALVGFARAQLVARALLGLFNAACLVYFQARLRRAFGPAAARWYVLLQASQFHVLFYASRTLPNMFAFGLTTLAFAQLLGDPRRLRPGQCRLAISLLTYATTVFRSELAILLSSTTLYLLLTGAITVRRVVPAFVITFVFSLLSSVPLDSYFWQKPIWPELWGFYYNAVLGSSSEWGVSPWHYYFTNALPKLMINPLALVVLVPYALSTKATAKPAEALTVPSLLFVAVYSLQPHKEARFIFYVVPPLTAAAALAANYLFTRRAKSLLYRLGSLLLVASVLASFAISTGMLLVSSLNYPGGEALFELRGLVGAAGASPDTNTVTVHTDVLSCMTGVTLFGQHPYPPNEVRPSSEAVSFHFDKTETSSALRSPAFWNKFDYVLVEDPSKAIGPWETVGVVQGFAGVEFLRPEAPEPNDDVERGEGRVLGRGALVQQARERVRRWTGGWWIGPRMEPQIRILKRLRAAPRKEVTE